MENQYNMDVKEFYEMLDKIDKGLIDLTEQKACESSDGGSVLGPPSSVDGDYVPQSDNESESSERLDFNINGKRKNFYMEANMELKDQIIDMTRQIKHDAFKLQKLQEENDILRTYVK
jgi:hypothetical protein